MSLKHMKRIISQMSAKDKSRLMQCVTCQNNPDNCGCDDNDEDENGLCKKYQGQILFVAKENK